MHNRMVYFVHGLDTVYDPFFLIYEFKLIFLKATWSLTRNETLK